MNNSQYSFKNVGTSGTTQNTSGFGLTSGIGNNPLNQKPNTNTGFFPSTTGTTNQTGNFMQNTIPSGTNTMFGKPSTGITGQTNPTSSYSFMKPQTNTMSSELSSIKPQQNLGLFGSSQNNQFSGISNQGFGINQNINKQAETNNLSQNRKDMEQWEIINVIQSYISAISTNSPNNIFKNMLYNRVPKGYENVIEQFQRYNQLAKIDDTNQVFVDYNLWFKALHSNPNPSLYYPIQISSPSQLIHRIKTTEILEINAIETIMTLQENLNKLNNIYDNDIENEASAIRHKLTVIKNKQLYVITKMEKLAVITGKADKNFTMENLLIGKLNNLKSVLNDNNEYTSKIKELAGMTDLIGNYNNNSEDKDFFKEFDQTRLSKNINILRDMKKIFDVTLSSLKENVLITNFIKNDLDDLKKYGKINQIN